MTDDTGKKDGKGERKSRWGIGSLRDALVAAGRDHDKEAPALKDGVRPTTIQSMPAVAAKPADARAIALAPMPPAALAPPAASAVPPGSMPPPLKSSAKPETARAVTPTRPAPVQAAKPAPGEQRTQLIRGRQKVLRTKFHQDPVVGWLVIIGGPGLGAFRPILEGNNTVGRAPDQRIPIDFGDDTISAEEQAYIRYDSADRKFLFVPNLAKTNVVQINDKKPTGAVELAAMDVITMGRTQLVFVPFCGSDFDWSELTELKA